jgi:hypothetical protein
MDFYNGTGPARGIKRPIAVLGLASRAGGDAEPACSGCGPQGVAQPTARRGNGARSPASMVSPSRRRPRANGRLRPNRDQLRSATCSQGSSEHVKWTREGRERASEAVRGARARRHRRGGAAERGKLSPTEANEGMATPVRRRQGSGGAWCKTDLVAVEGRCRNGERR